MNAVLNDAAPDTRDLRIAQALLARGRLKETDHARALRLQVEAGGSLSALLVKLGMVSERDMAEAASEVLGLPLLASRDPTLAAIAAKSRKETRYHCEHLAEWVIRLGDGTAESHARTQSALHYLHPYVAELFAPEDDDAAAAAAGIGPEPATLRAAWDAAVLPVLAEATLEVPAATSFRSTGRRGRHSEHLGFLLAEMQSLARAHPGARW